MPQTRSMIEGDEKAEERSSPLQMKYYRLRQERKSLQAKLIKIKQELAKLRESQTEQEFSALRNSQMLKERNVNWKTNVETWSKYTGFTINKASIKINDDDKSTNWELDGAVEGMNFQLNITVTYDEVAKKRRVNFFSVDTPFPCNPELLPWINKNDGNIEQILKTLKAYVGMNAKREEDLDEFRKKFSSNITITHDEVEGGKVIELFTKTAYFFQIRWKLQPTQKHFSSVKNFCRIACTKDGNEYIQAHTDLATIKKQLNNAPKDVLQLLAEGLRQSGV